MKLFLMFNMLFNWFPQEEPLIVTVNQEHIEWQSACGISNTKTYMDYRTITNTNSTQWYMQQAAWTAPNGIRCYGDRYMVAMGTYYSEQCGDKFDITLSTGQVINVIIGDIKADIHTDPNNMYIEHNQNIVEFIVDVDVLNSLSQQMGDVSYSGFEGDIISIVNVDE